MVRPLRQGTGPLPFQGVQTLTQTCPDTAPSGGAGGPFEDPAGDLPFSAPTWSEIAPGELRLQSAAEQTIVPGAGSPALGQAFDPIAGGGACASASGADQSGVASYRLDPAPAGGYTLMGSPTVIAGVETAEGDPSNPTSQVAARLLDVAPGGDATLVARGLYRPTGDPQQVFQLHPNGWTFAEGHVAKLELLAADAPYGRISNGQGPVTISGLELRLPVVEQPGTGAVQAPAPKVLPPGYQLAPDYLPETPPTTPPETPPTTPPTSGQPAAARTLSLSTSKRRVKRGRKVRLSGVVDSAAGGACEEGQSIALERRKRGGYRPFATAVTSAGGAFGAKVRVKRGSVFRASVADTPTCGAARSLGIKVRVKRGPRRR